MWPKPDFSYTFFASAIYVAGEPYLCRVFFSVIFTFFSPKIYLLFFNYIDSLNAIYFFIILFSVSTN